MTKRLLFFLLLPSCAFAQPDLEVTAKDGSKKLLGEIHRAKLSTEPYASWFTKQYDDYVVQTALIDPMKDKLSKTNITIFMGTWCGDTQREVPRFLKILDQLHFPQHQLKMICLDNEPESYKQSPQHEEAGLGIHRVPTFIIRQGNTELGRIVEAPTGSLEQDLVNLLNRNRAKANYRLANTLLNLVENNQGKQIEDRMEEFACEWRNVVSNSAELNTLGYVLVGRKKLKEAITVLTLNTLLYPALPNTYDSLAEAYRKNMNPDMAIKNYTRVLELRPNDPNALEKLRELEK